MRQRVLILCTHNSASSGKIGCCGGSCDGDPVTSNLYDPVESSVIPEKAVRPFPSARSASGSKTRSWCGRVA